MSETIKLNVKAKKLRAIIPEEKLAPGFDTFYEEESIKKELENRFSNGFQEGYEKAKNELEEDFMNQLVQKSEQFYNILSQIEEKLKEYEFSYNSIVLNVANEVAKKILNREIEEQNIIDETIKEAITKIVGANDVVIKVNPTDHKFLTDNELLNNTLGNFSKVKFEINEKIEKGGCLIETEIGNVDARVSSRIDEIIKALNNKFVQTGEE